MTISFFLATRAGAIVRNSTTFQLFHSYGNNLKFLELLPPTLGHFFLPQLSFSLFLLLPPLLPSLCSPPHFPLWQFVNTLPLEEMSCINRNIFLLYPWKDPGTWAASAAPASQAGHPWGYNLPSHSEGKTQIILRLRHHVICIHTLSSSGCLLRL